MSARPAVRAPLQAQVLCPSATGPAPCQASCLAGPRKSGVGRTLLSRQGARSPACTSAGRAADRQGRPGSRRLGRRAGPSSLLLQTPGSERSPPLCLVGWPHWSPLPTRSPPAGCRLKTRLGPGQVDTVGRVPSPNAQPAPRPLRSKWLQLLPVDFCGEKSPPSPLLLHVAHSHPPPCPLSCPPHLVRNLFASEAISPCFVYTTVPVAFGFLLP